MQVLIYLYRLYVMYNRLKVYYNGDRHCNHLPDSQNRFYFLLLHWPKNLKKEIEY